jgi:hypothetical protein
MYQAWMQGNDNYVRDWQRFVILAAKWTATTPDNMLHTLKKYNWFKT